MIRAASMLIPSRAKRGKVATVLAIAGLALFAYPRPLVAAPNDAAGGNGDAPSDDAPSDDARSDDAVSAARVAQAQAAFDEGRALLQQGRAREACSRLEDSQRLDPGLGTQLNLADCYERLGRFASAHVLFAQVAAEARATGQEAREEIARARALALEARVSQLIIVVPAGGVGLHVQRDGKELAPDEWNVLAPVDPGVHQVRAWGPGVGDFRTEVRVGPDGGLHEVAVPFDDAQPFLAPLHRKVGLAAAGVGVAGVLVGSFFGLRAISKKSEAERAGCDGRACATAESGELRDEARRAGDVATLAMSIGAGGLAAAAVLFWVVPELDAEGADASGGALLEVGPEFHARGGGLWLRAGF
jgi:serine/threonine-protein kinase